MFQQRRNVGCHKVFLIAHPHDERRAVAGSDNRSRAVRRNHANSKTAAQLFYCGARRLGKRSSRQHRLHEVRDNLGIGFGHEPVIAFLQPGFQFEIVFDDSVVHNDDSARAVAVRVCIFFRRAAVRCPARMANSIVSHPVVRIRENARDSPACLKSAGSEPDRSRTTAIPAESYPRYSSFRSPLIMTETTDFEPTYPTIPHIDHLRFIDSVSRSRAGFALPLRFQKKTCPGIANPYLCYNPRRRSKSCQDYRLREQTGQLSVNYRHLLPRLHILYRIIGVKHGN